MPETSSSHQYTPDTQARSGFLEFGSTSIKFYIMELTGEKAGQVTGEIKVPWDIGYDVFREQRISPGTMSRCLAALRDLKEKFPDIAFEGVTGVGTCALREAQNVEVFRRMLLKVLGVKLHIIEGGIEAFLLEIGFKDRVQEYPTGLFDLGGGSVELVEYLSPVSTRKTSIPVGAIRVHCALRRQVDLFEYVKAGRRYVLDVFHSSLGGPAPGLKELMGTGGTVRAIVQTLGKECFTRGDISRLIQQEIHGSVQRDLLRHRRSAFLPGLISVECLYTALGVKEITCRGGSVKQGLMSLAQMIPAVGDGSR